MTRTILYIEDDPGNIQMVERLLTRRPDTRMLVGRTASDGVAVAASERPDLILLDNHLPDGTGSEVLQRLAATAATEAIPVVIISGDAPPAAPPAEPPGAAHLGPAPAGYLGKPFRLRDFLDMIDRYLPATAPDGS